MESNNALFQRRRDKVIFRRDEFTGSICAVSLTLFVNDFA